MNEKDKYKLLLLEAGIFFPGPSKGSFIFPSHGLRLWKNIQNILNEKFAKHKVKEVSLPTLIPYSFFQKEAQHVKGLNPEFFQVQQVGSKVLKESLVLRPTSEVLFYDWFRQNLHSYHQLPFLYNQWCQVFRAEKNTKPFLRSTEFFWQEGHTLHESASEARQFSQAIWNDYKDYVENSLYIPVISGKKSEKEKFAGALESYTVECLLPDGQCLQLATSHYFGNEFCRLMGIKFNNRSNQTQVPFSTSWGTSTRAIGALAKSHFDEWGLIFPFEIAPVQIAFILIKKSNDLVSYFQEINDLLSSHYRCKLYDSKKQSSLNMVQANKEGCPLKIILGDEELKRREITLVRRDNLKKKITVKLETEKIEKDHLFAFEQFAKEISNLEKEKITDKKTLSKTIKKLAGLSAKRTVANMICETVTKEAAEFKQSLYKKSVDFKKDHIYLVDKFSDLENKIKLVTIGLFLIPFCNNLDCEATIPHKIPAYSIRCILSNNKLKKECIFCQKTTYNLAYLGRSY